MAASRARKQPTRQADYSNIGVAGRKTGITVKDSGLRDEYGLEPTDGLFSSPEKPTSPTRRFNGRDGTILEEQTMSFGSTSIPEPTEVLSARRRTLPPPKSRSPIKTHLNSSPRKSVGPPSSPTRSRALRSSQGESVAADNSFQPVPSPVRTRPLVKVQASARSAPLSTKRRKRDYIYDVDVSEDENDDENGQENGQVQNGHDQTEIEHEEHVPGVDDQPEMNGDTSIDAQTDNYEDEDSNLHQPNLEEDLYPDEEVPEEQLPQDSPIVAAKKRHRRPKIAAPAKKSKTKVQQVQQVQQFEEPEPPKNRGGRPRKVKHPEPPQSVQDEVEEEQDPEPEVERPQKKARKAQASKTEMKPPPQPSQRGRKGQPVTRKTTRADSVADSGTDTGRPKPRGLLLLRTETPSEEPGAHILRSGRTSVKPVAFWRNERIVYEKASAPGSRIALRGIKEVIRTEEAPPPERSTKKKRTTRPRQRAVEDDSEDEEADPWEVDTGVYEGIVQQYDSRDTSGDYNSGVGELNTELAYSMKGLNGIIRDVRTGDFQYAKTVTTPFFHSGVVDLPPQGFKVRKNSRKHHMIFWVFTGRVEVTIEPNNFSIGRGGIWQVPRGNWYSLRNLHDRPARVFFAQGSWMKEEENEEEEG